MKPLSESWDEACPLLRTIARATPKLLNAAYEARVACGVAGAESVKAAIAPDAKAKSGDGLAYQAVLRAVENLRDWGAKKKHPFAALEIPGGMASAIARAASQAYARRDQEHPRFASERIFVRASETELVADDRGVTLRIMLRAKGRVSFATAHSWGTHRDTLNRIASGELPHGDCKLQYDADRRKWYALVAYEMPEPKPVRVDPKRALAVHRGIRNALFLLSSTGERGIAMPGGKFMAQRRGLRERMKDIRHIQQDELGGGAKGHGRARRMERYSALEDKVARCAHTFCQQAAAFVVHRAKATGCGMVIIEDYGGIEPDRDPAKRRLLDRFPLYQLKQAIACALEKEGIYLVEAASEYISTCCPRCQSNDDRFHNRATGMFHCRLCDFMRPADYVAAWWLLDTGGADMTALNKKMAGELDMARRMRGEAAQ